MEDTRVSPHSPRSVPTTFDINVEPDLIQGNVLRFEPLPSGSHRNRSVPVQNLVQSSQGRGMVNLSKPLEGGRELLLPHQELSGSGEDHRARRRMESNVLQRQGHKDEGLVEEPNYFIHISEEIAGNEPRFGEGWPSEVNKLQASCRSFQRQAQRTSEEEERSQEQ
ncbi:hypothetical protein O181_025355 [Austropuccinia psidii MF-1]|uniref:Uncharacterized protein n=1 Tax=Austropuccinia psidii MF-1 TaxID=1389203 RepID=A0A9Q3CMG8_9BASI|nr:hypothetical protein [Austropuccinia psidii MF-1]